MIRIGLVGLGFMGKTHFGVYSALPQAQIVGICDIDKKRAAGDLSDTWGNIGSGGATKIDMGKIKGTTDYRELIARADVDVVDVCVPTPLHAEIAVAALEAGKHVVCEKPMARTSAEARRIATAAASARGFFMPAMCMRFWGEWEWVKRAIAEGHYGKVRSATFRRVGSIPAGWFREGAKSGGAQLDLHVHDVDYIYHLFGKPRGVFSRGYAGQSGEIDHIVTQYLFEHGPLVAAEGCWTVADGYGFSMRYTINFERATADYDLARNPTLMVYGDGKSLPVEYPRHDGYHGELAYFLECVSTRTKPERVTADDAVMGLQIVDAERRSIDTGQAEMV